MSVLDDVSIHEFLYAIKNAKYVVTDSYHGTCVSLIFHKQFLTIGNIKRGLTRFKSLLSEINLLDRMSTSVSDFYKILNTDIDYSTVTKSLNDFSDRSRNWLLNAINIRKNKLNEKTIQNLDPSKCSGCGTCASVCNKKAIEMVKDSNGFYRPIINNALCNDCGLCEKRCPVLHHQSENRLDPKCFAVMASDEIREVSSSGGMFTLAANEIISRGGIVCGAVYDGDFNVMHICSDSDSEIFKMRGSKYYQSKAWDCFLLIKEALRNGKEVLFTGTPCQVAGLKSYLFKQYDNLYTIDLLCHGISSKEIFDKYKKENLGNNTLNSLEFKSKKPWGWHSGINAMFSNGDKYQKIAEQDSYLQAYLYGLSKRESCMYCQGNTLPRQGDLTIGDFWKISLYDKSLNDNLGTSLVLVNNEKGMNLLERIKKQNIKVIKEVPIKFALAGNQIIVHPYKLHKNHNFFFRFLNKVNFNSLYKGLIDNKLYNEFFKNLCKIIPENEHLFYFIGKIVAENYKGRMIATWIKSEQFEKILYSNFGLRVSFYISENKNITGKNNIKHIDELKGLKNKVYIVSLDKIGDDNIYTKLNNYGFIEYKDFIFKIPKAQSISNLNLESGLYIDKLFNSVEGDKGILSRVIFRGFNNHIIIGKNVELSKDLVFDLSDNCIVEIGDNVKLRGKVRFELRGYKGPKTVRLGNNCIFYNNVLFRLFDCADAIIGEGVTSSSDFEAHVTYNKTLVIGNDCMFSYKNEIWAGDGHGIFDVETRKLINIDFENKYNEKNIVSIGSHVWIGKQATILNNSSIGNGSIIGAMSVIKGHFPNNCSIAGNPGKIVRSNIVWSRSGLTNNIESCGLEYINKTDFNYTRTTQGKNVLVVGGTGFLGIKLVQTLLNSGNKVTILSRGIKYENLSLSINRLYANLDNFNDVEKALKGKTF